MADLQFDPSETTETGSGEAQKLRTGRKRGEKIYASKHRQRETGSLWTRQVLIQRDRKLFPNRNCASRESFSIENHIYIFVNALFCNNIFTRDVCQVLFDEHSGRKCASDSSDTNGNDSWSGTEFPCDRTCSDESGEDTWLAGGVVNALRNQPLWRDTTERRILAEVTRENSATILRTTSKIVIHVRKPGIRRDPGHISFDRRV